MKKIVKIVCTEPGGPSATIPMNEPKAFPFPIESFVENGDRVSKFVNMTLEV